MKKYLKTTLILGACALFLSTTAFSQSSSSGAVVGNGGHTTVEKKVEQPTPVIVKTKKGVQRVQSNGNNTLTARQVNTPIKKQEGINSSEKTKVSTGTPGETIKVTPTTTSNSTLTKTSVSTVDAYEKLKLARVQLEKERAEGIITKKEYEIKLEKLKASLHYLKKKEE